jgi:uncharacterized protein
MAWKTSLLVTALIGVAAAGLALSGLGGHPEPIPAPPVDMAELGPAGRRITEDGLLGNFYPAPPVAIAGQAAPAILLLGGSEDGLNPVMGRMASALQAEGYAVLMLAYHRAPGVSPTLEEVPLELFDRALAWLGRQPNVSADRLAVVGVSKGAEAALLIASRNPSVRAVVAAQPSSVAWPGVDWDRLGKPTRPSWSVAGQPVAVVPFGPAGLGGGALSLYTNGLSQRERYPAAIIPIERARAAILLPCGGQDTLWPSCTMASQVKARADAHPGGPRVTVLAAPEAGHASFGLPVPANHPNLSMLSLFGGSVEANQAARTQSWTQTLAFLRTELAPR